MKASINIVIPIHNEEKVLEKNITSIIDELKDKSFFEWSILLVENGSKDRTLEIAKSLENKFPFVKAISIGNANYGLALQKGFLESKTDFIVNFDIDYWDTRFVEVAASIMPVRYDILIASKNLLLSRDRRGFLRKLASYVFRMILFFIFGLRVSDTHGIKAWRNSSKLQEYFAKSFPGHHTYDTEIIIRAIHGSCEVLEIPVDVIETRITDHHIVKRVPKTLSELYNMFHKLKSEKVI